MAVNWRHKDACPTAEVHLKLDSLWHYCLIDKGLGVWKCGVNRERETWINLSLSFHFIRKWVKLKLIAVHNQGKSLPNASFVSHTPSPREGEGEEIEEGEAEGADEDELHIVIVMALWSAFTFYGLLAAGAAVLLPVYEGDASIR